MAQVSDYQMLDSSDSGGSQQQSDQNLCRRVFKQDYLCYSLSYIGKDHLEAGNKIIIPSSALGRLMAMDIEYPILFEIDNPSSGRVSHCGVLEFSAEEGLVYLPNWMIDNMKIQDCGLVSLKHVSLPKGKYMKIQPHDTKFVMNFKNPRDVLEAVLKDFTCVTAGDTIEISHEGQKYCIDIVETKPSNSISLFETDCKVDFAPPLDYKEPEKKPTSVIKKKAQKQERVEDKAAKEKEELKFTPFTGVAKRLDGQAVLTDGSFRIATNESNAAYEKEKPTFRPFTGVARRLDEQTELSLDSLHIATNESNATSRKRDRNLAFGAANDVQKQSKNVRKEDVEDQQKLKTFTGKEYTLTN